MKPRLLIAAALACALASVLQNGCTTAETVNYNESPEVTADSKPVTFDFLPAEIKGSGMLTIPVSFNGHEERCMIDTGAQFSFVIKNAFFESLPEAGRMWYWGASGEKLINFRVQADHFEIGGVNFPESKFMLNEGLVGLHLPYACVLGLDVLSQGVMKFDFTKKQFQFLRQIPARLEKRPLTILSTGHFGIPFSVNGMGVTSFMDTGATSTYIDPKLIAAQPASFHFEANLEGGMDGPTGHQFTAAVYRMKNSVLDGVKFPEVFIVGKDLEMAYNMRPQAILGINMLRYANWMFDLRRKQWAVF